LLRHKQIEEPLPSAAAATNQILIQIAERLNLTPDEIELVEGTMTMRDGLIHFSNSIGILFNAMIDKLEEKK